MVSILISVLIFLFSVVLAWLAGPLLRDRVTVPVRADGLVASHYPVLLDEEASPTASRRFTRA